MAVILGAGTFGLGSCSSDDGGGKPVITGVRTTDPETADSLFTDASLGQMIVLIGQNLQHAKKVYINGQEVSFNANYNTSTHLIVTIPGDLITYGMDESVPMEIWVDTPGGRAVYNFHVTAGKPSLDFYTAEMVLNPVTEIMEVQPGTEIKLNGSTLHEVSRIYVADLDTVLLEEVPTWKVNEDRTVLTFPMTSIVPAYGLFVVECYTGTAYCGFSKSPMPPSVYDVIPSMPIPGQTVTVFGKYLTNLTSVNIGGEIEINLDDVQTSDAMDRLTFVMPDQIPSRGANGVLTVKTLGGRGEAPCYRYDWIYEDFDGNGTAIDWGWGTNAGATQGFAGCDTYAGPEVAPGNTSNHLMSVGTTCWWDHNYQWNSKGIVGTIPADTPLDKIELRYSVYIKEAWTNATAITNTVTVCHVEKAGIEFKDAATGELMPGQWMTIAVPLSEWSPGDATYGDFCAHNKLGDYDFKLYIAYDNVGDYLVLGYDNFHFYIKPEINE